VSESVSEWDVEVVLVLCECLVLQLIENGCCSFEVISVCEHVVGAV
jgi:hypothetical protein